MMDLSTLLASDFPIQDGGQIIAIVAVTGGILIAMISVVACTIKGCVRTSQVEQTRREIAAYVAEGSISPEDGERLMKTAGREPLINRL